MVELSFCLRCEGQIPEDVENQTVCSDCIYGERVGKVAVDAGWGREWAEKEVSKGQALARRYQEMTWKYVDQAGQAAEQRDFAAAAKLDRLAREARDSMHYWLGHMNAFQGISAQFGVMEIVETELDEEGSCL